MPQLQRGRRTQEHDHRAGTTSPNPTRRGPAPDSGAAEAAFLPSLWPGQAQENHGRATRGSKPPRNPGISGLCTHRVGTVALTYQHRKIEKK